MKVYTSTGLPKQSTVDLLTAKGDLLTRSSTTNSRLAVGTDTYSLLADSGQTLGLNWGVPQGANPAAFIGTGTFDIRWTGAIGQSAPSVLAPAVGTIRAYPVYIPRLCSIDRIMFEQTGGASGGGVARVGVYASTSNTNPAPAALVYDSGEFSTTAAQVWEKTISPAVTMAGPGIFWLANLTGTAVATMRSLVPAQVLPLLGWPSSGGANFNTGVTRTFSYAALPDPFGSITAVSTSGQAAVGLRFAT